ncbi:MAG: hypothetical protein J5752_01655 [Clostridiales bacterium]|nr:hypothetical protein [Clostridiales bacterium]
MEEPERYIIYQDDKITFEKAGREYALSFNGNTYLLRSIIYEPSINIKGPEKILTVHNSFTMETLVSAIENNGSMHMISGNDYDVTGVFALILKAIELERTDIDLSVVEEYRFLDLLKERGADSFEKALSPADFGLKNCKMTSFIHSKKIGWTVDGRFYIENMEDAPPKVEKAPDPETMERFSRVISNQVRFGYGFRTIDGRKQFFAWHGYPNRNDDYFTTAEITEEEFRKIGKEYPFEITADRETAEVFRSKYVDGHTVLMEAWNRTL